MARISPDMLIRDVLASCPEAADVFEQHGLGCASCLASGMETLSAVATVHDVDVDTLISQIECASSAGHTESKES